MGNFGGRNVFSGVFYDFVALFLNVMNSIKLVTEI